MTLKAKCQDLFNCTYWRFNMNFIGKQIEITIERFRNNWMKRLENNVNNILKSGNDSRIVGEKKKYFETI